VIVRYLAIPAGSSALIFNANGATGTKNALIVVNNTATALPDATGFTNQGYEFTGWNTAANGSGTPYALGASITTSTNTPLFAQWSRTPVPSCAPGVGKGGPGTSNFTTTKAGNGCVGISYKVSGVTTVATFNYTGTDQSWTVPTGVTSATFYLIGAGGGGGIQAGGGGGYATGEYSSLIPGQTLTVIVGEGGGGVAAAAVTGYTGRYTPITYGGGGRGGSIASASANWFGSGGGRSAIRLPNATTDLATAAGGGGGSYGQCGFGAGGLEGLGRGTATTGGGRGGTQSAGGAGGTSANSPSVGQPGTPGAAYLGGDSKDEGGGGGGGYFGGGGGGDNTAGAGGSSYVALLTGALTVAGSNCGAAAITTGLIYVVTYDANSATSGSVPSNSTVSLAGGTLTLASNTGTLARTNYTFNGWNTAANGSGTSYAVGATTFSPSGDTTLYAQWDSTITYNGNGQTSLIGTVPAATTAKGSSNTTLAAPTTLLRTNYIFDGWNTAADGTGTPYTSGLTTYTSTGSRTLYAQWKAVITFDGNTNSGGTAPAIVNAITSTITLPSNTGSLVKTGYSFAGWNTVANGTGTTYAAGDSFPITGTATLYANWTPSNAGLTPSFNTNTSSPIGVLAGTAYVINNVYTNNANDLVLSQYADKIQIIATVPSGTLAITTTTNLTLPIGYQAALNTAATTISFVGNLTDVNAALASLKYTAAATAASTTITIYASYAGLNGNYRYNPATGNSYSIGATALTWDNTFNPTTTSSNCGVSFNNMCGYVTVPNDSAESLFIAEKLGLGWIGIMDVVQGTFKYVSNAPSGGSVATFTQYQSGYSSNATALNARIAYANGTWLEATATAAATANPIYEFGGKGETPIFATLTRTIAIGALATPGTPTLATTSDTGTSNSDKITNDNTPDINISGLTVGATVTLTATPASGTAVTCTFVAQTTTQACTFPTMPDGTYSIVATQTLGGTTTAASTALANVVIDATRPTVTLTSSQIVSGGNLTATPAIPTVSVTVTVTFSESVSGLLISEITKNAESSGWTITTTAFTTAAITSINFVASNATGAGGTAGIAKFSVAAGVASDVAGNTNTLTTSEFIINTLIQLTLTNEYQQSPLLNPVVGGNNEIIAQTTPGGAITLPGQGTLTRAGHTFAGWSLVTTGGNGAVLGATYTPTVPVKLYSSWIPNVYVVTYNANGGNGAPTTASQNFTFGGAALAPSAKGTLTRTGYTFAGWSINIGGTGTIYSNSTDNIAGTTTTYTPSASITFYAKWTAGTFAVTFDANGGTGTQIANMSITAGTAKALTANTYTRSGYTFGGWNTLANGTGTAYANSASVTLFGNTTIYAQWIPVTPGIPTVAISGSAGNTQITVAVNAASLGATSGPATSFTVTSSPGAFTCTITSPATTCTFTGLTNGVAYTFTAVARNTTGNSVSSAASASATPAPFEITYSLNGGTLNPTNAFYNFGTPVTLPLPTRSGYTFIGWNNPSGTSVGINGGSYSPPATITLTAQWSAVSYVVFYNGNGSTSGTVPASGTFSFGSNYTIVEKGSMAKSGYTFAGWTTASNGTGTLYANTLSSIANSAATYSSAGNLTLYAKWIAEVYAITYDTNGATGSASKNSDSFTFGGTSLTLPTIGTMAKTGYAFGGWSETNSGTAVVNPYSPTQTRTLYAIWVGIQYLISYNVNGGTGSLDDVSFTTGTNGITLNNGGTLSRTGYTFGGWKTSDGTTATSPFVTSSNVTLNAVWTPKIITVTYLKGLATNTTNFPTDTTTTFGTNFSLSANVDTSTVVVQNNYAFAGWLESVSGVTYKPGDSFRISTEATLIFTAQWIRLFEVTYNANGGTFANGDGVNDPDCGPSKLCANNLPITLNAEPSRVGFTFAGWVSQVGSNLAALASTNVTETNYIFYATWTANSYTITFAKGTGAEGSAASITGTYGEIVSLASSTGYTLAGSIFSGWLIGSTTYAAGAFYTLGTHNSPVTATAQYVNNTFKIFYNTNGATSGTAALTSAVVGAAITLNAGTTFTKDGYDFDGWSDGTQTYLASAQTTMGSANSTLVAQWKVKLPAAPAIASVTGSDGGATIVITPGTGGGAATSYTVTSSPAGDSCVIYASATSCSITPLVNGTAYTFTVSATNSTGTTNGAISALSATPAGKPDAPTGVTATRGNGQAVVTFTAPVDTGGSVITSYAVTAYDSNGNAAGSCSGSGTSYTCTGLTNGSAYTFKATATNASLTSDLSTASLAATPATLPGAPTSVSAAVNTAGAATVSFTAPANNGGAALTGFTVISSPVGFICSAAANASSCVVTGLTNGTAYTFTVVATNEIGDSVASTSSSAVTPQSAASAPTTVTATAGDGQASIAFSGAVTNGSTIASYTVQAYDSNGNEVTGATCISSTSPCTVTGLSNGSEYTFKVVTNSTVYGAGITTPSLPSSSSNAITPATAPDSPSEIEVTAGTGKISVSWAEPAANGSAILSYTVQAYDSSNQPIAGATCTVNAPTRTCDVSANLVAGANYTFKVTATSAAGTSAASAASTSVSVNAEPSAPINVIAVGSNASATVSWDPPININGSAITEYTVTAYSGSTVAGTCTSNASDKTCVVSNLTNGVAYTFKVTATNGIGTSALSTASSAVTPSTVPNAPTTVSAVVGDTEVTISFVAPVIDGGSTVTGYKVIGSDGTTLTGTSSPLKVTGLTNGTSYTFTVQATNANGDSVVSTASSSVTPAKAPDAPSSISVTEGVGKVSVSWTAPASNGSAITSYTVQAYDNSGSLVVGATCLAVTPAVTCDVSTNLVSGINYTFKVTATNTAGTSSPSTASSEAAIIAAPSVPINATAVATNARATVSWDAPVNSNGSAITGYTVTAYSSNNLASGNCTTAAPTLSCEITGLTNGSPYTFKVTATNGIGTSGESLASAAATPSTVPNAPEGITVAAGDGQVIISFTAPANNGGSAVTGYTVLASNGSTTSGSTSPLTLTGLTNGTAYTFTVKATNINGDSIASSTSVSVTPVESRAPQLAAPWTPSGQPYVGSTLTSNVSFSGSPTPTVTHQWKVCDSPDNLASCTNISGATSTTYTPTSSDTGKYILVEANADNGVGSPVIETSLPTAIIKAEVVFTGPSPVPGANAGTAYSLSLSASGGATTFGYTVSSGSLPAGLTLDSATGQLSGTPTTAGTYTFTVRATDSNGMYKDLVVTIVVGAVIETCDSSCRAAQAAAEAAYQAALAEAARQAELARQQEAARLAALVAEAARLAAEAKALTDKKAAEEAARLAAEAKAVADKKAAEEAARIAAEKAAAEAEAARIAELARLAAEAKALADKKAAEEAARIAAEKAAAEKLKSDAAANAASLKAKAEAEAAIIAAKAAVEKAAAAEVAKIAADAAALAAATKAKAAADAQAAADKAATTAATVLKNSSESAATKATATKSAQKAVADAATAVKAAVKAAQVAAAAQNAAANANKQVDIAINSLNSKTAAAKTQAQANAIAAAAKAAANEAAALAATKAVEAKAAATAAQKAASDTAARIATEQKEAAASAALAKSAADEFTKATAEKISATTAAKIASEALLKALEEKANLADQAVKATDSTIRSEIEKKIEELTVRITQAQKISEEADTKAESAAATQEVAAKKAESTKAEAEVQAAEAVAVKSESVTKTAAAVKAAAAAVVAAKVATAAKEAAAKVPSKAVISTKPSTSTKKNSATATVTGLKPGQKVKVTVNVRPKP
jgi:uncharacterized repeat protein (TIGR02543 family)